MKSAAAAAAKECDCQQYRYKTYETKYRKQQNRF